MPDYASNSDLICVLDTNNGGKNNNFCVQNCVGFFGHRWLPADLADSTLYQLLYRLLGRTTNQDAFAVALIIDEEIQKVFPVERIGGELLFLVQISRRGSFSTQNLNMKLVLLDTNYQPLEVIMDRNLCQKTKPPPTDDRFARFGLKAIEAPFWFPSVNTSSDNNNNNPPVIVKAASRKIKKGSNQKKTQPSKKGLEVPLKNPIRKEHRFLVKPSLQTEQTWKYLQCCGEILQPSLSSIPIGRGSLEVNNSFNQENPFEEMPLEELEVIIRGWMV